MNVFAQGADQAFVIKDGVWTTLPRLNGLPQARAHAINDNGVVVGESLDIITGPTLACMWQDGSVFRIELPIGPNSSAADVNAVATTTGRMGGSGTAFVGYVSIDNVAVEIPELRNASLSEGLAVNDSSTVAGQTLIAVKSGSVPRRSWVFKNKTLMDLGDFPENSRTIAFEINHMEQVVGYSLNGTNGNQIPFLWQNGKLTDLRTLVAGIPPDFFLRRAVAINNRGLIVVTANGTDRFAVLAPIDRPVGDINLDCVVDERDLVTVLDHWGPDKNSIVGDIADIVTSSDFQPPGDGQVDGADLAVVLGNWSVSGSQASSERSQ